MLFVYMQLLVVDMGAENSESKWNVFDTIKVSNIPTSASESMLALYFESPRRSEGGPTVRVAKISAEGKAVVKFHDPAGFSKMVYKY